MSNLKSNNFKMITLTLWMILGYNALFVWTEFFPQYVPNASVWVYNGLESIRVPLTIVELIAIGTLFVDLVVRFDQINERLRLLHVTAVGICVCGFIFKVFVYFLHSAYLS